MSERPILFSAPMVRAILEGRKTQTRRVVKGAIPESTEAWSTYHHPRDELGARPYWWAWRSKPDNEFGELLDFALPCPHGKPGDLLWVRETWCQWDWEDLGTEPNDPATLRFRADGDIPAVKWRPSIFMPRWASRITLKVTDVRIERLQDISEADAEAEGVTVELGGETPRMAFESLWYAINGVESWDANPWVWVVSFERVTP